MDPNPHAPRILQFGVFEVDLDQGELRKNGRKIKLQDRPFQLLAALLERPGQVVTREELVRRLWNDTLVDFDNGLNIATKKIRDALDDNANTPRYVETLPRRGYRFIAPVQARAASVPETAPIKPPEPPPAPKPAPASRTGTYTRIAAVIIIVWLAARIYWLSTQIRNVHLIQVAQVTQTGQVELGKGIATDGTRVYFTERDGGRWSLGQVSVEGGTPSALPLPLEQPLANPDILDISPDHSTLLVASGNGVDPERPLWLVPTAGGSPRRLGDVAAHAAVWSRDASRIVFANGSALHLVAADGADAHKLVDTPGIPYSIRWAPATRADVLRFSLISPKLEPRTLWEVDTNGANLHPFLHDWNAGAAEPDGDDNGNWDVNGKYYLFRALRGGVSSVYAMRAFRKFPRAFEGPPVLIYSTPMQFSSLTPHPDGKRVFFAAGQERRELQRYDARRSQFAQFLPSVQARWLDFSKDGQWIAYVTAPDNVLWRSRPDGTERLQLTPPTMRASQPRWSPDGTRIAFGGAPAGQHSRIYIVAASGGAPEPLTGTASSDTDPTWSPGGGALAFACQTGIYSTDLKTKQAKLLPGSAGLIRPAWSPDAASIAATNQEGTELVLLNPATQQKTSLVTGDGLSAPIWSKDGKYVYSQETLAPAQPIFRVALAGPKKGTKEVAVTSKQIPQSNFTGYLLAALAPTDAPVATVIYSNSDIYALGVDLP